MWAKRQAHLRSCPAQMKSSAAWMGARARQRFRFRRIRLYEDARASERRGPCGRGSVDATFPEDIEAGLGSEVRALESGKQCQKIVNKFF